MLSAPGVALAVSLLAFEGGTWAAEQPSAADALHQPAEPQLPTDWTAPVLVSAPPVPWPQGVDPAAWSTSDPESAAATVILDLTLDAEGRVGDVAVLESSGDAFTGAVLASAADFQFSPALSARGQPVPARIQYVYRFTVQTLASATLAGRVRVSGGRQTVEGARVVAHALAAVVPDGSEASGPDVNTAVDLVVLTEPDGRFDLSGLSSGRWRLSVVAPGYSGDGLDVSVAAGEAVDVALWLVPDKPWKAEEASETVVIFGDRLPPEVTQRRLDSRLVRVMPGTGGDVLRAVQTQPGVARTPFSSGTLLVRGMPADASRTTLGGLNIPLVFHFGGLATAVNGELLDEVSFLPGSYGTRYGRSLGGVVDLVLKDKPAQHAHGYASLDILQATVFHEQPVGSHASLSLSLRRSYIDALLAPVVNQDPSYRVRLPAFMDGQLRGLYRSDSGLRLSAMMLGSDDRFTMTQINSDGEAVKSELVLRFLKGRASWIMPWGHGWQSEVAVMGGPEELRAEYATDEGAVEKGRRQQLRVEVTRPVPDGGAIGWRLGAELARVSSDFNYALDDLDGFFLYADDEQGQAVMLMPAIYVEQTQRAGPLVATPGVRVDWLKTDADYAAMTVDPRLQLRLDVGPVTQLSGGVGSYSQFPQLREITDNGTGDPSLGPERAVQTSVGIKHHFLPELSLEGTVYASFLSELIVGHDDRFTFELSPPPMAPYDMGDYANDGAGRTFGLELLTHYEDPRWLGFLALTLARSTRVERPGQARSLFEYDQPVALTTVASRQWSEGWRTGARVRLTSGNPYTPVVNRIYDLDEQGWLPLFADSRVQRMPAWFGLDLRADKEWTFRRWTLSLYLDIQNATNRKNVELLNFSPDFDTEIPVLGLPILPTLGVRGGW